MKSRSNLFAAASLALIASSSFAQHMAAVDPAVSVDMRVATSKIAAAPAVELSRLRDALSSLTVVAIVGESAIMKTERLIPGLPRDLTMKSGRTFAVLGVPVVPTVLGSSVEFFTPNSSTPVSVSRLGEQGAEVLEAEAYKPESADVVWQIQAGSSIRAAITDWSQRAGWQFVWELDEREDFQFMAGNRFTGDFRAAVFGLFNSLPQDVKVRAELRPDNTPPMVLITRDEGIR